MDTQKKELQKSKYLQYLTINEFITFENYINLKDKNGNYRRNMSQTY